MLVVTHDRWFLDEVCTSMWEVHDGQVDPFEGGYSAYILQRVERDRMAAVTEERRRNMARKELAWLSRGAQARSTKPKFRVDAARELIADVPPVRDELELKRLAVSRLGKQVIDVIDVDAGYADTDGTPKQVLTDVTWLIGAGDRYGLLGENGAGKSTLLDVIQSKIAPLRGRVKIGQTVRFGSSSRSSSPTWATRSARCSATIRSTTSSTARRLRPRSSASAWDLRRSSSGAASAIFRAASAVACRCC